MSYNKFIKNNNLIIIFIFLILSFSLFVGFFLNENSTGGARQDYLVHDQISIMFFNDFKNTLLNYDELKTRHSPLIPIYFSIFKFFEINDYIVRLIHLPLALFLVLFFYKCLEIKFDQTNKKYLFIFSSIILLSPTVRSLSIWPDSHFYGLIFFLVAIYFFLIFLKVKNREKLKYAYLNIIFLVICSYIRPSFSLFGIYFLWYFYKEFGFKKKFYYILLLNFILALPAFYYLFYLKVMFLSTNAVNNIDLLTRINPSNKILIISSIITFHLIPLVLIKIQYFKKKAAQINLYEYLFLSIIFFISIFYFDYKKDFTGGGIFFHLSNLLGTNFFFFIISFLSLILIYIFIKKNFNNIIIIFLIFLSNPQLTIYHKYYDPLILIIFFLLIDTELQKKNFNLKSLLLFYSHSFLFLILSLLK